MGASETWSNIGKSAIGLATFGLAESVPAFKEWVYDPITGGAQQTTSSAPPMQMTGPLNRWWVPGVLEIRAPYPGAPVSESRAQFLGFEMSAPAAIAWLIVLTFAIYRFLTRKKKKKR